MNRRQHVRQAADLWRFIGAVGEALAQALFCFFRRHTVDAHLRQVEVRSDVMLEPGSIMGLRNQLISRILITPVGAVKSDAGTGNKSHPAVLPGTMYDEAVLRVTDIHRCIVLKFLRQRAQC